MNPILLKLSGDRRSHVIVNGKPAGTRSSRDLLRSREDLWSHARAALDTLRGEYDLVVAEGAGAGIEPNLAATEIVNLRVARYAGATTLIVGDIYRGGVFGHLVGMVELMSEADRELVAGFLINRFRGDGSLLAPAIENLEARTGSPVLGVIPWIEDVTLAEEDAVALERREPDGTDPSGAIDIAVIHLPRIANFDDFDPLRREPGVSLRYVSIVGELGEPDLLILPGTCATIADLEHLRQHGLDTAIREQADRGTHVLGICGGYQILGYRLLDPDGVEAPAGTEVTGLGLLRVTTTFGGDKQTMRASGTVTGGVGSWAGADGEAVAGYDPTWGVRSATLRHSSNWTATQTARSAPTVRSRGRTCTASSPTPSYGNTCWPASDMRRSRPRMRRTLASGSSTGSPPSCGRTLTSRRFACCCGLSRSSIPRSEAAPLANRSWGKVPRRA